MERKAKEGLAPTEWNVIAGLAVLTLVVFAQVASHEFLNFDDPQFVTLNQAVKDFDLRWAFTSTPLSWMPLTWISYMLDFRIFGLNAGGYLIENAILHAVSASLLFLALRLMTKAVWPSAFVAALFAVHPMHVESVAWVAERKDVLSTLFVILAILCYARGRLALTAVAMALSLMAKQTYVTLPFLLLVLDDWPIERLRGARDLRPLLMEKVPLFILSILGSVAAYAGQKSMGAITSTEAIPIVRRFANAAVAYIRYVSRFFVPVHLAVPYEMEHLSNAKVLMAVLLLVAVTAAAVVLRKRAPYFFVGWLWFVGTLVPVIGIVQIGGQAIADRYTYFSYVGLFIAIVWGALELDLPERTLAWGGAVVIALLAVLAFRQTAYWKNPDTLFTHTIAVTPPNAIAEYSLGQYLQLSDPPRALTHLRRAIELGETFAGERGNRMYGWYPQAHAAAGAALLTEARSLPSGPEQTAKLRESIEMNERALRLEPSIAEARQNIAVAQQALAPPASTPNNITDYFRAAIALGRQGKYDEAVVQYRNALALAPNAAEPHVYLALGLLQARQPAEAAAELQKAKAIDGVKANEIVTRALHMAPGPDNLDMLLGQIGPKNLHP